MLSKPKTKEKTSLVSRRYLKIICTLTLIGHLAYAKSQPIILKAENYTVRAALNEVAKQTNYNFFYENAIVDKLNIPNINIQSNNINEVLETLLKPLNLNYKIIGNTITIAENNSVKAKQKTSSSQTTIKGKVVNTEKKTLAGVTITVVETNKKTSTNQNGDFQIDTKNGETLLFNFIGYKPQRIVVTNDQITVTMQEVENSIEEVSVVSTGYQTINKKLFTGSASTVQMKDIKIEGATDVSRMLEGRVAGVSVQNVSGTFGSAPKLRVRGATSITGDNKPLWVVDGVVLEDVVNISNDQLSSGDALTLIGSSVAGINTEDIESLEILKDASATAMYGARAMNGVVVITTKKGRIGKPMVNYSGNFSTYLKPTYSSFNIMNSVDQMSVYLEMERKGLLNFSQNLRSQNGGVFTKMYQLIDQYDSGTNSYGLANTPEAKEGFLRRYANANTNWFDILFTNSFVQEHALSVSSGTENVQHYLSGSYYKDSGWTIADNVKRYTANMRSDYKFTDKLTASAIVTASLRDQLAPGTQGRLNSAVFGEVSRDFDINPYSYALNTSRTLTARDEYGDLEYFTKNFAPFNIINELAENKININVMDFKGQAELGYKFLKNLDYKILGSFRYVKNTREHIATENSNMANTYRADGNGDGIIANSNGYLYNDPSTPIRDNISVLPEGGFYIRNEDFLKSFYGRQTLSYKTTINDLHQINAFIGQEIRYADRQNVYFNGYGIQYYKGGNIFTDYRIIKQAVENNYSYFGVDYSFDRFVSMFSNINYAYDNKYVVNLTARYDGSNKMGKSKTARYLPTWTISGAWNVDEEKFMDNISSVSYLKLRGTYGLTASMGNATNTAVIYNNTLTKRGNLTDTESMIEIASLENAELTWESQYETNLGLDLGLFNNKINFNIDVYNRNSFNLINVLKVHGIGGQSTKIANYADMNSKGIEFTVGGRIYSSTNFSYRTNLTFGYNQNEIKNLKNTPRVWDLVRPEGGAVEGSPVRGLYSVQFHSLDHLTGVPQFINQNGNISNTVSLQSTNISNLKYEGSVDPLITGGFNNTFNYKGFSLNVFISYQLNNKIRLDSKFKSTYSDLDAMPNEFQNRWLLPGDEQFTNIPSIIDNQTKNDLVSTFPYSYYNYSSARVVDGSFVRLKTIALNYSIPKSFTDRLKIKTAALAFNANNIALLYANKELYGQDPEFFNSGGVALPMPKQFTLTLKLGL